MFLNTSIPEFECLVRSEFLYDLQEHTGEFERALAFGVSSVAGRALGFHVMTECGACVWRLPVHALCHEPSRPKPLDYLELWDCFSNEVAVTEFDYLSERACWVIMKDRRKARGEYVMTFDWTGSAWADGAGDNGHKCLHLIALETGHYALQPNNRILWHDPAWVTPKKPDYKTNTRVWKVENSDKWTTENTDKMFYEVDSVSGFGNPEPHRTPGSPRPAPDTVPGDPA